MAETIGANIDTVIWDLDGTLLDSFGVFESALKEVAPRYGYQAPTSATIVSNYHGSLDESVSAVLGITDQAQLHRVIGDFLEIQNEQYEVIEGHLYDDAEDLAARLHAANKRQLVVTNRDHVGRFNASPRSIVANSELSNYIDAVICGDDSQHRKPMPAVLGRELENIDPERTAVIGDQFVDAQFAYNLGALSVLVCRDGLAPPNMDRLDHDWQSHVVIVGSLRDVEVT